MSNANPVPVPYIFLIECDGCKRHSTSIHRYYNPEPKGRRVLPSKLAWNHLQVCNGCRQAYGPTMEANGWKLQEKLF